MSQKSHIPAVSFPNIRHVDLSSSVNGRQYALTIALPSESPLPGGYGVFYLLDGYSYFASAVEAVRSYHGARGVVVVGIGYSEDPVWVGAVLARHSPLSASLANVAPFLAACAVERAYDMNLPASDEVLAAENVPGLFNYKSGDVGGLDDFLKMIETEIKPQIAAVAPVDPSNQAFFGHSLGGLAVLHALFTTPSAFRTFVASSPAIYRSRGAVLAGEAAFAAAVRAGSAVPRVLITVGGEEGQTAKPFPIPGVDPMKLEAAIRRARMIENAVELTARLKSLPGTDPYKIEDCVVFDKMGHALAAWPALARAVAFAFAPA